MDFYVSLGLLEPDMYQRAKGAAEIRSIFQPFLSAHGTCLLSTSLEIA
jgi:hypothetical protein